MKRDMHFMTKKIKFSRILIHLFLISYAITCLFPLLWMISTSLKSTSEVYTNKSLIPQSLNFENYIKAWTEGNFSIYFTNSVIYTISIVLGIVIVSTLAAYAFARLNFPFKNIIYYAFLMMMLIPIPGAFVPLYVLLVKLGIQNTRIGYILPMINSGLSVSIFILKEFFEQIPKELEESAVIDGCGKFQVYYKIMFPLALPAISTIVIFNALSAWNEYILAAVNFTDPNKMPVQQGLFIFQGQYFTRYELLMAATTITTLPIIMIYLSMQKYIVRSLTGAIKG